MASLTIRNLDDSIKELLRIEAAHNGHSMEEEARLILRKSLVKISSGRGLGRRIQERFAPAGGVELDLPTRDASVRTVEFDK
ncbi:MULTISPECIES: FitA-like ribbon-helix-helix domain-containing protein [Pseudomonas]|uniref:Plasmid stabilization protein n=1 Tax=Pseudomonas gessardii TaxID=78544 RepID=A0ABS9FDY8_9PSED|nr:MULTISPECIES: plasmid stabilization protein [Pseudomonas]MBH3424089.1 plasmid stabilization protein [Pseudomonas gessardii]MCF4978582.1 plasmid stabilization protein [Pseudomonas gessardii]MCF4989996.1 plasmid stabilization protein [Pseudomonas gessardii]MCF5086965.1 plasmid stabilization protein [Pseudomonas gessardii]MCF5095016.1 plasmid stabilization protein [Pseudomonas gessardii]